MPMIKVLDSTMYYEDSAYEESAYEESAYEQSSYERSSHERSGHEQSAAAVPTDAAPLVFLHGNPTSSHLWRHVLPAVGGGRRLLAPDLIGMGRSGKPDIAYTYADQARYLDAWFEGLGIEEAVLIGTDWGGSLAFDRAARHPEGVRGVAFMETILRPMSWEEFPEGAREQFRSFKSPGVGEELVLERNAFVEDSFAQTVLTGLSEADHEVYRAPYPTPESRRPMLQWPRSMPLDGEPAEVVARIEAYDAWLADSPDVPKLLLTFEGSPTLMIDPAMAAWCEAHISALETAHCGPAGHQAPEDRPEEIAAAITAWADRHGLGLRPSGGRESLPSAA